jgi:TonB family protein
MSTLAAWLVYCGVISAVLTTGALAWESSARWSGRPARWGWAAALAGSVSLPWLLRLLPRGGWPEPVSAVLASLSITPATGVAGGAGVGPAAAAALSDGLDASLAAGEAGASGVAAMTTAAGDVASAGLNLSTAAWPGPVTMGAALWVLMSLGVLLFVWNARRRMQRVSRHWQRAQLDGGTVYVSERVGPAALGVRRGLVVVPAWALQLGADVRGMLLEHEREHLRAGDPRTLFAGLLCLVAMPWNPIAWYQFMRLRSAIELDCDVRVLRRGADPRAYGRLLLEVGRRRSHGTLAMATFAEPRSLLEERIRRIVAWPAAPRRGRAAVLALLATVMAATALSARDPLAPSVATGVTSAAASAVTPAVADAAGTAAARLSAARAGGGAAGAADAAGAGDEASARTGRDGEDGPVIAVFLAPLAADTPVLANRAEVEQAMAAAYPTSLREQGTGGVVLVWAFVAPAGTVQRVHVGTSSGSAELDRAALGVVSVMRFSIAGERPDGAWVELPLAFGRVAAMPARTSRDDIIRLAPLVAAPAERDAAERDERAREAARGINELFREGRTLEAVAAARAALLRGEITAEQADLLSQMAATQGFQAAQRGDRQQALAALQAARGLVGSERSGGMVDFFQGYVLLRQAHGMLGSGATAASAATALPLLEQARGSLAGASAYGEQEATRRQLMTQLEQLSQVAEALARRGR